MRGYIILAVFVLFVFACFFSFLGGLKLGKKQVAADYAEEQRRKEQSEKEFKQLKDEIKQGYSMKRKTKKLIYLAVLLAASVLIISITACGTTPRVEYIHEIPDVVFPVFPPPDCVTYDDESDLVSMPLWYWQKIAEYKIDVDAIQEYLSLLRVQATGEKNK